MLLREGEHGRVGARRRRARLPSRPHRGDGPREVAWLARKLVGLRLFPDAAGRFDRSLADVGGTLGLVSQFTLYGDASKGRRPSFGDAAAPEIARPLFELLVQECEALAVSVVTGRFGASMRVSLVNDGPVTLWLDTEEGL